MHLFRYITVAVWSCFMSVTSLLLPSALAPSPSHWFKVEWWGRQASCCRSTCRLLDQGMLHQALSLSSNAFITAIDYFAYIYPGQHINRKFSVLGLVTCLIMNTIVVLWARKSDARIRINVGIVLFMVSMLTVPILDLVYVKGRVGAVGLYLGYQVSLGAVVICGAGTGMVQSGMLGSAGELPKRYMQAVSAGIGASGMVNFRRGDREEEERRETREERCACRERRFERDDFCLGSRADSARPGFLIQRLRSR